MPPTNYVRHWFFEINDWCVMTPLYIPHLLRDPLPYPHGQFGTQMPNKYFNYCKVILQFKQYFNQLWALYSNSCYTTFSIATLGMCIACEVNQLWAVRPCIYHIFRHLTKWLIFCRTGHAITVYTDTNSQGDFWTQSTAILVFEEAAYNLFHKCRHVKWPRHLIRVRVKVFRWWSFPSPTNHILTSFGFLLLPLLFPINYLDSSQMISTFREVLNFNRLFLKLNQFICNQWSGRTGS